MKRPLALTSAEDKLLALILEEIRRVTKSGEQLSIIVDPHIPRGGLAPRRPCPGVNVCFSYNGSGRSFELEGDFRAP